MRTIQDRARMVIDQAGFDRLVREGSIGYSRWQSVRYKAIRMSTEELEVLQRLFPEYSLWLISGKVAPECGQRSPEHTKPKAGL